MEHCIIRRHLANEYEIKSPDAADGRSNKNTANCGAETFGVLQTLALCSFPFLSTEYVGERQHIISTLCGQLA